MKEPQSQQPSGERFNDDPVALIGLPPSEKKNEFWKRYDRLADIHDKKMTSNLSENLDVLLIFAGLFSAINTAFISLTMPSLSSDPLAETNALLRVLVSTRADNNTLVPGDLSPPFSPSSTSVMVNCLLYGSLSCSLLAAVGAMMAKEWLQSFDRTGQTGPLEEQAQFRQRKFNGVRQWHLESIIQFLPNLLLLSVILFFAGVCLFLFPVNKAVAFVVIAFSAGGAALCAGAIVAGAASPLCPYQSAASRALRRTGVLLSRWWRRLLRAAVDNVVGRLRRLIRRPFGAAQPISTSFTGDVELAALGFVLQNLTETLRGVDNAEQAVIAQSAGWLLGTTSNRGDQLAAAQFVCALNPTLCVLAFEEPETWQCAISLTRDAFNIWYSQPDERNQDIAELFGLVLCHVLMQFSEDAIKRKHLTDFFLDQPNSFGGTFLQALELTLTNYPGQSPRAEKYILHIAFLSAIINRGAVIKDYHWSKISDFPLIENTHCIQDTLFSLWAIYTSSVGHGDVLFPRSFKLGDLVKRGENKQSLALDLSHGLCWGVSAVVESRGDLHSKQNVASSYAAWLRRARELSARTSQKGLARMARGAADFIVSYIDPTTSFESTETNPGLVRISIEAVFALGTFVDRNPPPEQEPSSRDVQHERRLSNRLIDAAVDIMLSDPNTIITLWAREQGSEQSQRLREQPRRSGLARILADERDKRDNWMWEWERNWEENRDSEWEWGRERARRLGRSRVLLTLVRTRLYGESCIIRIIIWVWKNTPNAHLDRSDKRKIFLSSCRLWAPLEAAVSFASERIKSGNEGEQHQSDGLSEAKLLTSDDLNRIVEFTEYLRNDRENHEFIAYNADVGINRLYVHLNRRANWDYELYDPREQRTYCSRSMYSEDRMV